jgi:hypothetical protein
MARLWTTRVSPWRRWRGPLLAAVVLGALVVGVVLAWPLLGRVWGAGGDQTASAPASGSGAQSAGTPSGGAQTAGAQTGGAQTGGAQTAAARPGSLLPATAAEAAQARTALAGLAVIAGPGGLSDYRRDAFGPAWSDTDHNGCNQRDDVLLRDVDRSRPFTTGRQGACDHDVLSGTWVDPYSGVAVTLADAKAPDQAPLVQIDHIVALSVAWRYGAAAWDDQRRLEFANDQRNLVASAGASNEAKGGSDASQWQPAPEARCGYAVRYIAVKDAYGLPTDRAEAAALGGMLATCPG